MIKSNFEFACEAYGLSNGHATVSAQTFFTESPRNMQILHAVLKLQTHTTVLSEIVRQAMVENQRLDRQEIKRESAKVLVQLTIILNEMGLSLEEVKDHVTGSSPTEEYAVHKQLKPHVTTLPGMPGEGLIHEA